MVQNRKSARTTTPWLRLRRVEPGTNTWRPRQRCRRFRVPWLAVLYHVIEGFAKRIMFITVVFTFLA